MMKITELLNAQPTHAPVVDAVNERDASLYERAAQVQVAGKSERKMDMASLDRFAQAQQRTGASHTTPMATETPMRYMEPKPDSPLSEGNSSNEERHGRSVDRWRRTTPSSSFSPPQQAVLMDPLAALASAAAHSTNANTYANTNTKTAKPTRGRRLRPMTDEEKRAKQRMLVKRSYYRKLDTLTTLRETVVQLEQEYNQVARVEQEKKATGISRHSIAALVGGTASSPEDHLRQSFQEMAVSVDQLRREHEGLRQIAMEQSKARTRLGILVQEEFRDQIKRGDQYASLLEEFPRNLRTPGEEMDAVRARLAASPSPEPHTELAATKNEPPIIHMTPISQEECMEVVRDAYDEIMAFRKSTNYVTTGGHVFGWRDRRKVAGDYVQFALEKTFKFRTPQEVATSTWNVLSTEAGINRIYSSSIRAKFHLVQRVSPHNVVFYRTMERVGQNLLIKSLILASLVEIESGYMVLFRSIDPAKRNVRRGRPHTREGDASTLTTPLPEPKEIWVDMFSWGVFEPVGKNGEHCVDFFGGFVPTTIATSVAFWMMEVLLIAVRCESECVGPLFILPHASGSDADDDDSDDGTSRAIAAMQGEVDEPM